MSTLNRKAGSKDQKKYLNQDISRTVSEMWASRKWFFKLCTLFSTPSIRNKGNKHTAGQTFMRCLSSFSVTLLLNRSALHSLKNMNMKMRLFGNGFYSVMKVNSTFGEKKNEAFKKENLRSTSGSVLVQGCMTASGVGHSVFIDEIMDQNVYLKILQNYLQASVNVLGLPPTGFSNKIMTQSIPSNKSRHGYCAASLTNCIHQI